MARKDALEDHRLIKVSTYGIIFMGTPHQGCDGATLGKIFLDMASIFVSTNDRILRNLQKDSELLQSHMTLYNPISRDFVTKFAYETYTTSITGHKSIMVSIIHLLWVFAGLRASVTAAFAGMWCVN